MTFQSGVSTIVDKMRSISDALRQLSSKQVLVGIPAAENERKHGTIGNAALGYIHEKGAPEVGIPARPWLIPSVRNHQDEIASRLKTAGRMAFEGKSPDKALTALGLFAQSNAKASINSNIPPPLSEATLADRKRRGVTRENTLVDTGQLRNAIEFVIRKRG